MARPIDPDEPGGGGTGDPGEPGYTPDPSSDAKIALVVTGSNVTITADQITAAGGPWPVFKLRVTPINDNGSGVAAEVNYPPT